MKRYFLAFIFVLACGSASFAQLDLGAALGTIAPKSQLSDALKSELGTLSTMIVQNLTVDKIMAAWSSLVQKNPGMDIKSALAWVKEQAMNKINQAKGQVQGQTGGFNLQNALQKTQQLTDSTAAVQNTVQRGQQVTALITRMYDAAMAIRAPQK